MCWRAELNNESISRFFFLYFFIKQGEGWFIFLFKGAIAQWYSQCTSVLEFAGWIPAPVIVVYYDWKLIIYYFFLFVRYEAEHVRQCLHESLKESPIMPFKTSRRIMGYLDDVRRQIGSTHALWEITRLVTGEKMISNTSLHIQSWYKKKNTITLNLWIN